MPSIQTLDALVFRSANILIVAVSVEGALVVLPLLQNWMSEQPPMGDAGDRLFGTK